MKFSVNIKLAVLLFFVSAVCAKNPSTIDSKDKKASPIAQTATDNYIFNHQQDEPTEAGYDVISIYNDKYYGGTPILTQWNDHYKKNNVNFVAETALDTPAAVKWAYKHPKKTETSVDNMEIGRGPVYRAVWGYANGYYATPPYYTTEYESQFRRDATLYLQPQNDAAMNTAHMENHPKEKAAIKDPDKKVIQDEKIAEGGFIISDKYRTEAKKHPEKAATQAVNVGNSARINKGDINFDLKSDLKFDAEIAKTYNDTFNKKEDKKLRKDFKKDKKVEKRVVKINNTPESIPLVPYRPITPSAIDAHRTVGGYKMPLTAGQQQIAVLWKAMQYGGTPFKDEWTDHTPKQDQTLVAEIMWDNPPLEKYMYNNPQDIKPRWQTAKQGSGHFRHSVVGFHPDFADGSHKPLYDYIYDGPNQKKTARQNYVKNNPKPEKVYTAFTDTNDNKIFQDERLAANVSIIDPKYRTEAENHPEKAATQAVDVGHYIPDGMIRGSIRGAIKFNQNNTKKKDAEYDSVPFFFGLVSPKTGEIRPPVMHAAKKHAPQSIKSAKASITHNVKADEGIKHSISFVEKNGEKLPENSDSPTNSDIPIKTGLQFDTLYMQAPVHLAVNHTLRYTNAEINEANKKMNEKIAEENKKLSEDENKRSEEIDSEKETEESDNEDLDNFATREDPEQPVNKEWIGNELAMDDRDNPDADDDPIDA